MINKFPPGFEQDNKNIAIDFDGVIHNFDKGYHDGTCYGDPISGSLEAIQKLSTQYNIIIFTAKAKPDRPLVNGKTGVQLVSEWLEKHGVLEYVSEITSEKPRAVLYIDDNGYRFNNWENTLNFIQHEIY
jgi:ribonucleotide monophosphatase NagD (HAD superfamily)